MNKTKTTIRKNLSTLIFLSVYLVMVVTFLFLEGFQAESQLNILTIMLPCTLLGIILDYTVNRNTVLTEGQKIFTRILPSGIIIIYFIMLIFQIAGRPLSDEYNYIFYLFISVPFMIVSYNREGHRSRMLFSLLGTVAVFGFYLSLTTKTEELNEGSGLIIFIVSYFMMFYAASTLRKLPYLSTLLGILVTVILWYLYKNPQTPEGQLFGWDYDYMVNFEYIMLITFILCILIRLVAEFLNRPEPVKAS